MKAVAKAVLTVPFVVLWFAITVIGISILGLIQAIASAYSRNSPAILLPWCDFMDTFFDWWRDQ